MDPSSPEWNGYSEGGWEQQRWFGETDDKGQPVAEPTVFGFSDVDGMFGPGGFQNRIRLPESPFGGGLGGLQMRSEEKETSSLLHILGSDLFHGALDGDGDEDGAGSLGRDGSAKPAGRLDELNSSAYPVPGENALGSLQAKPMKMRGPGVPVSGTYTQGPFSGHTASNSGSGFSQGAPKPDSRGLEADANHKGAMGEHGASMHPAREAHGQWMHEQGASGNFRGARGQGPQGYGAGGPMKGGRGHWTGPGMPFQGGGAGGRGGHINHMRGGAPADVSSGMGPGFRPGGTGPGVVFANSGGRGTDNRHQLSFGNKGAKSSIQGQQQAYMNGRIDARQVPAAAANQERPPQDVGQRSEVRDSGSRPDALPAQISSRSSRTSAANLPAPVEEGQVDNAVGDDESNASAKEAAEKARKEAKRRNKKEKLKKGREDSTPSSTPQDTPIMEALQSPEQAPPLASLSLDKPSPASDQEVLKVDTSAVNDTRDAVAPEGSPSTKDKKGPSPSVKPPSTGQLAGVGGSSSANKAADVGKAEKAAKSVAPSTKKPKDGNGKKGQHNQKQQQAQRKGRVATYAEDDVEEEQATSLSLQATMRSLKQWALSLGKAQPRRRGRSKAYRVWIHMGLRALMVVLAISAITSFVAPGAGRQESFCLAFVDSVRRTCKDTLGYDCRILAKNCGSMCYVMERCGLAIIRMKQNL